MGIFGKIFGGKSSGLQQDPRGTIFMPGEWEDQFPTMTRPDVASNKGFFSQGMADKLSNAASGLGAAAAYGAGDFDVGADISQSMAKARQAPILAQQKREQEWEDWKREHDYELSHPKAQPYRWERNDGSQMELGPDGKPRVLYDDPTPRQNFIPDGMGGGRWEAVPRGPGVETQAAPPTAPVGKLTPLTGGGASNGTGGFRYRR